MDVLFYNSSASPLDKRLESHLLSPIALISDRLYTQSETSIYFNAYEYKYEIPDERFLEIRKLIETGGCQEEDIKAIKDIINAVKKMKRVKHKDPKALKLIFQAQNLFKSYKKLLAEDIEEETGKLNIKHLLPLVDTKEIHAMVHHFIPDNKKEKVDEADILLTIGDIFCDEINLLSVPFFIYNWHFLYVEDKDTFHKSKQKGQPHPLFVSARLFSIPGFYFSDGEEFSLVRKQILSIVHPIYKALLAFRKSNDLLIFNENISDIANWLKEEIIPLSYSIQKQLNKNVYVQKEIQSYPDYCLDIHLGISSYKILLDYYYKTGVFSKYHVDQIDKILSIQGKQDSICPFLSVSPPDFMKKLTKIAQFVD